MATIDLPDSIERQLLVLDRQVRDATFSRGISRIGIAIPALIGACLFVDWYLGLNGAVRLAMLFSGMALAAFALWQWILRPAWYPASFAELAALVERQHPELKERLTSLVELREQAAPGASTLMRDLLARQTARALDKLDLSDAAPAIRSPRTAMLAVVACILLFVPFAFRPDEYQLLWARFFAPLGNFHWGATELVVVGGDRVVAKGSDVPVEVELRQPSTRSAVTPDQAVVWLHWTDAVGTRDSRRLEWDVTSQRFTTTLPHVASALEFHAATADSRSESHRIEVANPPVITRLQLDIEPPAYTGLPARALDGALGEIHAPERSRIVMKLEFDEPVVSADLVWPILPEQIGGSDKPVVERTIVARLADDRRSATVEALALSSGSFRLNLKNSFGLKNEDPPRSLVVDPDLPPAISLGGNEQPVSVRPDDRYLVQVQVQDDRGLTIVELHLESSTGKKRVDTVPVDVARNRSMEHEFPIDVGDFEVTPGQAITYRVRAVDNRPIPGPQETWTKPRTLMIELKSELPVDKELAEQEQDLKDEISELRNDLAVNREAIEQLHRKTEDESLKGDESDKSEQLEKLQQQQAELKERLQKLAAELADNPLTRKLGERAQKLADQDLAEAQQRLEQAKQGESRDQLQPLSEAIDRLGAIDRELKGFDQQLAELNRLQQDLAQLEQLARNTDRLAEKLEQLEKQSRDEDSAGKDDAATQQPAERGDPVASNNGPKANADQPADVAENPELLAKAKAEAQQQAALAEERKALQTESRKLNNELDELLKKHPELLDAARRDQLQRLEKLAEQAEQLAKPQEQLAQAFEKAATDPVAPNATAEQPASQPESLDPANPPDPGAAKPSPVEAGAAGVKEQRAIAQEATRQAQDFVRQEGPESKAAQSAVEFAKRAIEAARQAETGNLDQAATQGQAAAESAKEAASELVPDGEPATPQSEQANQLAERQEKLAEELRQLADDKGAQQGAREQGQQQLADATDALAQRLEQAAKNLQAAPLDSQGGSEAAQKAQQAANDARQAMKQATEASKANNAEAAQEQAALAAEKLKDAAAAAQNAPEPPASDSVPEELGTNVAQAAQQLRKAQEQLEALSKPQGAEPQPGQPEQGQPGDAQPGEGQPDQGQPGQGQPGQGQPGQGQPGQGQPGQGQPGQGQPGQGQPGQGQPGQGQPGQGQPGQGQPGQGQPGQGQPGQGQPGQGQPGQGQPGQGQPGQGQPGQGQPGQGQPGQGQPGQGQPGQGQPGQGQPGQGQPGQGQPGQGQPGQSQPGQGQPGQGQPGQGQPGQGQPGQGQPGQGQPGQGQPGQGQPGQGQPGQGQPGQASDLGQSAQEFRRAAAAMRFAIQAAQGDANGQPGLSQDQAGNGKGQSGQGRRAAESGQQPGNNPGNGPGQAEQPGGDSSEPGQSGGAAGGGALTDADLQQLDAALKKQGQRNWGRLPGQLQTEILQGATKKPRPEYAKQIKSYFEEIAKPATQDKSP